MTENNTQHGGATYSYGQGFPPAPRHENKQRWFKKPIVWLPAVAAVVAFGLGSGSASAQTVEVEKQVIKEVPGPERTRTVTKEVTPAACIEYVNLSEQAFTHASEVMGHISNLDSASANASTKKLQALAPQVNAAKAECRSK